MTQGERIIKARNELGLTVAQLASNIGVTEAYLKQVELNKRNLSDKLAYKLDMFFAKPRGYFKGVSEITISPDEFYIHIKQELLKLKGQVIAYRVLLSRFVLMRVKFYLRCNNWTVYELAKRSGLSYSTLNNLMIGRGNIGIDTLMLIVTALGVSLDEFFKPYYEVFTSDSNNCSINRR